jgi:hypothetical protein
MPPRGVKKSARKRARKSSGGSRKTSSRAAAKKTAGSRKKSARGAARKTGGRARKATAARKGSSRKTSGSRKSAGARKTSSRKTTLRRSAPPAAAASMVPGPSPRDRNDEMPDLGDDLLAGDDDLESGAGAADLNDDDLDNEV